MRASLFGEHCYGWIYRRSEKRKLKTTKSKLQTIFKISLGEKQALIASIDQAIYLPFIRVCAIAHADELIYIIRFFKNFKINE